MLMKRIFTLAVLALMLTGARASVVINATNFPDENFRAEVAEYFDTDGDGVISDEEMANNGGQHNYWNVSNLKGIELLTSIYRLLIINYPDEPGLTTFDYTLPNLTDLEFQDMAGILKTVDATKCVNLERFLARDNPASLSTLKLPGSIQGFTLDNAPLIKTFDPKQFPKLRSFVLTGNTGITDVDFTNHEAIRDIDVEGGGGNKYQLNSLIMSNCKELANVDIKYSTIKSLTFKSLPELLNILVVDSDITNMLVEDMAQLGNIEGNDNDLGTLTLNKLPAIGGLQCINNRLQTLLIDDCPNFTTINAENNRLMWLDLTAVKKSSAESNYLTLDNQNPSAVAYKLSPTEVGLRVHERMDPARMLNLVTNGKSVTAAEIFVDDIRYIVFSNEGVNAESLKGKNSTYEYETKWPYPWAEGNSKDNNLPVNLYISSVTKHQAFLTLSASRVEGVYGKPAPAAPTVTRSQDYDGKITFSSSNENVVKVDPDTGVLTVIGAGTAIISVSGEETDYRLAPVTKTYTVYIEKATPIIAFPVAEINATYGETVPLNQLTVTWYEGTVTYQSANEKKAVVDAATGVVTTKGAGDVVIKGIAPETSNFYRAEVNYVLHIAKASPVFAFEKNGLTVALGAAVPENKLNVGLYDGEVQYASSDETVATVDAQGVVTTLAIGEVTITATGAETENCNEAKKADYTLTVADPSGISGIAADAVSTGKAYDLQGRKVNVQTARKGVYVVGGKKMVVM